MTMGNILQLDTSQAAYVIYFNYFAKSEFLLLCVW